ncbi:hypothetical protein [Hyphomicrobium sp. D-2]|uniref:hypothetical protein n=1 Tax=Hyphomicrobium sp. D-2 TaxID=3041621 RepID=UPI0024589577|nr:hypothetical protein [Hyphomicrobium sp. D-2]MDH4983915.1 hypothetical protein [Hyphomicrobium sp. D-2]
MDRCSHSRVRPVFCAVVAGAAAVFGVAFATPADAYTAKVNSACERDYYRLCAAYSIGTPELRSCMTSKRKSLSPRCVRALVDAGMVPRRYLAKK